MDPELVVEEIETTFFMGRMHREVEMLKSITTSKTTRQQPCHDPLASAILSHFL